MDAEGAWEVPWQCSDSGGAKDEPWERCRELLGNDCRVLLQDGSEGRCRGRGRRMTARGRVVSLDRGCGKGGYLGSVRGVCERGCEVSKVQRWDDGMGNGASSH